MSGKNKEVAVNKQLKTKEKLLITKKIPDSKFSNRVLISITLFFTALLYSKSISNGFVNFDDNYYVLNNPFIRNFSFNGIKEIFTSFYYGNYHPLTSLVYLIEYTCFALDPMPYHILNVLLHLLNVWLVFRLTEQLSGKNITALVVALLFAIHPMNVEPVAWVSSLKDLLSTAFYLLSILCYLRYFANRSSSKLYLCTILLFVAAMISKSAAVTLPILFIAIDIYKGSGINSRILLEKIPFLLLSLFFGVVNIFSQRDMGAINYSITEYGLINRLFLLTSAVATYIAKFFLPVNLCAIHYLPKITQGQGLPLQYYVSPIFLAFIVWLVLKKSSIRKDKIFGVSFFLIAISVSLQIVPVGSHLTAERYAYLPYIGLFYIIGQWFSYSLVNTWRTIIIYFFLIATVLYSIQTWIRIGIWKNDFTFFSDIIQKSPDIYFSYWMRGNSEKLDGDFRAALQDYDKTIELNPDFEDVYFNRGTIYDALDSIDSAILDYSQSILLKPKADVYNNRGWDYSKKGDFQSALRDYTKAISLNSTFTKSYFNRASIQARTGNFKAAIGDYNSLIKLNSNDNEAYCARGYAYFDTNDTVQACKDWKKAIELGNENAIEMARKYCQ